MRSCLYLISFAALKQLEAPKITKSSNESWMGGGRSKPPRFSISLPYKKSVAIPSNSERVPMAAIVLAQSLCSICCRASPVLPRMKQDQTPILRVPVSG